jgi:hypothetical protein
MKKIALFIMLASLTGLTYAMKPSKGPQQPKTQAPKPAPQKDNNKKGSSKNCPAPTVPSWFN